MSTCNDSIRNNLLSYNVTAKEPKTISGAAQGSEMLRVLASIKRAVWTNPKKTFFKKKGQYSDQL